MNSPVLRPEILLKILNLQWPLICPNEIHQSGSACVWTRRQVPNRVLSLHSPIITLFPFYVLKIKMIQLGLFLNCWFIRFMCYRFRSSTFHNEVVETFKMCATVETSCCCVVSHSMSWYTSCSPPLLFEVMNRVVFSIVCSLCEELLAIYPQSNKAMTMYRVPSVISHNDFLVVDVSLSWELNPKTCYC